MTKDEIRTRARAILATTLKADPQAIADDVSQANLSEWDSVRHMNVVIALENEFGIEFEDAELQTLTSLPLVVAAIERHTASQPAA
jgi:acyl carrier protein